MYAPHVDRACFNTKFIIFKIQNSSLLLQKLHFRTERRNPQVLLHRVCGPLAEVTEREHQPGIARLDD